VSPPRRAGPDDEDTKAFEEAMKGATPLDARARRGRAPVHAPEADPGAVRRPAPASPPETGSARGAGFSVEVTGETVAARAPGVDARQLRRLRAGEHPVEARLDLHGSSRAAALAALERFLASAEAAGQRCVLVVHGRGNRSAADGPVVRPAVWEWLADSRRTRAAVLAFTSAPPRLGGAGATLVLLRRPRPPG
jgi:DNA-nicking Smr family endonuclease